MFSCGLLRARKRREAQNDAARRRPATGRPRTVIEWPRYNCCDGRIVQRRISCTAERAPHDRSPSRTSYSVGGFWYCWRCPSGRWGQSRAVAAMAHWRLQRRSHFPAPKRDTTPAWPTAPEAASHAVQPSTIHGEVHERSVVARRQAPFVSSHHRDCVAGEFRGRVAWTRGETTGEGSLS